ncbi:MAG: hypothetical protein Q7S97_12155 [Polaromonas sp.]|nr:hypothetical protein [Burkholderiales bacterium]MDO8441931.1 hypothetical protein [Polaromonas sp.]
MNRQQQIDHFVAQAHLLAMQRLREQPGRVGEVQTQLENWRKLSGATSSDVYWDEWESLLSGSLEALANIVCSDNDHAKVLRSVSPMSVLITQSERAQMIAQARQAA